MVSYTATIKRTVLPGLEAYREPRHFRILRQFKAILDYTARPCLTLAEPSMYKPPGLHHQHCEGVQVRSNL